MSGDISLLKILWHSGLVVKLVMLLLLGLSVISWAIFLKKKKELTKVNLANQKFLNLFKNSEDLLDVLEKSKNYSFSPLVWMFQNSYGEFLKVFDTFKTRKEEQIRQHFAAFGPGMLERGLKKGATESNQRLETLLPILASVGSLAPFIGLFGTVIGIINSFTGLSSGGTSLETVAPGIAEALVVTAFGLVTAIPAVWFYNYLNQENQKLNSEMEAFAQDFLNLIERSLLHDK